MTAHGGGAVASGDTRWFDFVAFGRYRSWPWDWS